MYLEICMQIYSLVSALSRQINKEKVCENNQSSFTSILLITPTRQWQLHKKNVTKKHEIKNTDLTHEITRTGKTQSYNTYHDILCFERRCAKKNTVAR